MSPRTNSPSLCVPDTQRDTQVSLKKKKREKKEEKEKEEKEEEEKREKGKIWGVVKIVTPFPPSWGGWLAG